MAIRPLEICLIAENRFVKTNKLQYGPKICFCASEVVLRRSWGQGMHFECRCCPSAVRCVEGGAGRVSVCAGAVRRLPVTSVGKGSLQARALRFVEKAVLRKRKEPHFWGSEGAMGFEGGFRFGHATGFTRLHRLLAVAGFSPTLLESLVVTSFIRSRWAPGCAGPPILLAEALVRLRADGRRRTRKYAGTSVRVRFWGARRSVRGYLAPRFRLHRRTEHGRQRRVRTAFRG